MTKKRKHSVNTEQAVNGTLCRVKFSLSAHLGKMYKLIALNKSAKEKKDDEF